MRCDGCRGGELAGDGFVTSRRQRASGLVHRSRAICEPIGSEAFDSGVQSLSPISVGADHHVHGDVHAGVGREPDRASAWRWGGGAGVARW